MRQLIIGLSLCLGICTVSSAEVKPNHLFGDHMVLQSGLSIPVWGTAAPGEQVTVTLGDQKQSASAGPDGKWMIHLASLQSGGPLEMSIAGTNTITIHDVLVGEVWVGSGQSNMEFPFWKSPRVAAYKGVTNQEQEDAAANYPQLRMYTVKTNTSATEQDDSVGEWQVCTPDNVKTFSGIGYFFSRDLQKALKVPVGFIHSSFGRQHRRSLGQSPCSRSRPSTRRNLESLRPGRLRIRRSRRRSSTGPRCDQHSSNHHPTRRPWRLAPVPPAVPRIPPIINTTPPSSGTA